jgi:hypothetical protein
VSQPQGTWSVGLGDWLVSGYSLVADLVVMILSKYC